MLQKSGLCFARQTCRINKVLDCLRRLIALFNGYSEADDYALLCKLCCCEQILSHYTVQPDYLMVSILVLFRGAFDGSTNSTVTLQLGYFTMR